MQMRPSAQEQVKDPTSRPTTRPPEGPGSTGSQQVGGRIAAVKGDMADRTSEIAPHLWRRLRACNAEDGPHIRLVRIRAPLAATTCRDVGSFTCSRTPCRALGGYDAHGSHKPLHLNTQA